MKKSHPPGKVKITLSLSRALVAKIDRLSADDANRSRTAEHLLASALRAKAKDDFDAAIVSYYDSLEEHPKDIRLSAALTHGARKLAFDDDAGEDNALERARRRTHV